MNILNQPQNTVRATLFEAIELAKPAITEMSQSWDEWQWFSFVRPNTAEHLLNMQAA